MNDTVQIVVAIATTLAVVGGTWTGYRVYRTSRQDSTSAAEDRMLDRLEREVAGLRVSVTQLWVALNGHKYREYLWLGVRYNDSLQIRQLGGIPADLPPELQALPDYPMGGN